MGCSISTSSQAHPKTPKELRRIHRIRKSQISPPVLISISIPFSPSSKHSDSSSQCDAPAPPRPPTTSPPHNTQRYRNPNPTRRRKPEPVSGWGMMWTIQPPTPQKELDSDGDEEFDTGFRIGNEIDEKRQKDEELAEEMHEVGIAIDNLVHCIRAYSFVSTQTKTQTLSDIDTIIKALPRPPRGLLVRQRLEQLQTDIANLYSDKHHVFGECLDRILAAPNPSPAHNEMSEAALDLSFSFSWSVEHCLDGRLQRDRGSDHDFGSWKRDGYGIGNGFGLVSLWSSFLLLPATSQKAMAGKLRSDCTLMRMFDLLSALRVGGEELRDVDLAVSARIQRDYEFVLEGLRECEGLGVGGGEEGVMKGLGEGMRRNSSMQWRVLCIVEGRRREDVEGRMEDVRRGRGKVSVGLLGVIEGLGE